MGERGGGEENAELLLLGEKRGWEGGGTVEEGGIGGRRFMNASQPTLAHNPKDGER